jgi:hypothetical protein
MWIWPDVGLLGHGHARTRIQRGELKKATVPRGNLDKPKKLFRLP